MIFTVLQIDPSCQYENIISVSKFEPKFNLCGGINLPKILLCVGSDGIKRRQLIKVIFLTINENEKFENQPFTIPKMFLKRTKQWYDVMVVLILPAISIFNRFRVSSH